MALTLCSSCNRHVRSADAACPFCGETPSATASRAGTSGDARSLPRAKRAVAFVALSVAATACGGTENQPADTTVDVTAPTSDATTEPTSAATTEPTAAPTTEPTPLPTVVTAPATRYGLPPFLAADELV